MNSIIRLVALVAGLVLLLNITPSWGQPVCVAPGCNPTTSDVLFNTAGGTNALNGVTTGTDNTAFGRNALSLTSGGDANTAIGAAALFRNTTGNDNTASGVSALVDNTTGNDNTASGFSALADNTTGSQNTASAKQALLRNTTGGNNTASGAFALFGNTAGNQNTASGASALNDNTTGSGNTAVGFKALRKSTGTKNIGIGYQAGVTLQMGNNNIYIGSQGAGNESQTIRIGTAQTQTFIAGIGNAIVSGPNVEIDTNTGQLGISGISSARYKREIESMGARSAGVLQLRPVTFAYRQDAPGVVRYGLVAEEVQGVYPEMVTRTATGEPLAVRYQELIPMLLNELQRQRQELAEVAMLRKELAELRALVGQGREMAASSR